MERIKDYEPENEQCFSMYPWQLEAFTCNFKATRRAKLNGEWQRVTKPVDWKRGLKLPNRISHYDFREVRADIQTNESVSEKVIIGPTAKSTVDYD